MKPVHFLDADELAAVAHPLRQRMLGLLVQRGELSGRQIRDLIPDAPKNPYYHLDILRNAGLVRIVREERRRGSTEKYYAPVARTYSVDPGELVRVEAPGNGQVRTGILSVARTGAEDAIAKLASSLESDRTGGEPEIPFVNLCTLRLTPAHVRELRARMEAWLKDAVEASTEDSAQDDGEGGCHEYALYQLFFRTAADRTTDRADGPADAAADRSEGTSERASGPASERAADRC